MAISERIVEPVAVCEVSVLGEVEWFAKWDQRPPMGTILYTLPPSTAPEATPEKLAAPLLPP